MLGIQFCKFFAVSLARAGDRAGTIAGLIIRSTFCLFGGLWHFDDFGGQVGRILVVRLERFWVDLAPSVARSLALSVARSVALSVARSLSLDRRSIDRSFSASGYVDSGGSGSGGSRKHGLGSRVLVLKFFRALFTKQMRIIFRMMRYHASA